jgi:DNA-binding LacI/PurR family transcriptional regulator
MKSRVTSQQVAKQAGVSRTTVSFILNDVQGVKFPQETRERVLQAAQDLGYVPDAAAQTLASGKTYTVGLVLCQAEHLKVDSFISQAIYGVNEVCNRHGFRILIESADDVSKVGTYQSLVRAKKIDGLVVINSRIDDQQLYEIIDEGFPTVLIGSVGHPSECAVVHESRSEQAVKHLLSLGHERIAHVTLAPLSDRSVSYERFLSYRRALDDAGIRTGDELERFGNYSAESGFTAMQDLLRVKPYPTAVFVGNDTVAVGVMAAIGQKGLRIPQDIAVVGYDDIPIAAYTSPPLTTVRVPASEPGSIAGEMVISLIRGEELEERVVRLESDLIIRESCGASLLLEERGRRKEKRGKTVSL